MAVPALVAAFGVVTGAPPAMAVVGLQYASVTSGFDSTSPKSLAVSCPAGTVVIGGGAYLTGSIGDATIRQIAPTRLLGLSLLLVQAEEDPDGYAGSWLVSATAVCVPAPSGLTYVRASVTDPALVWATASCGARHIIGSGYTVSATGAVKAAGAEIDVRNRAYVSAEPSRVAGAVVPVTATAIAVCADAPLPGQQEVVVETVQDSVDGKSARAFCPPGTQVVGVSGDLLGFRRHTVIDDFMLFPGSNSVLVTGYEDQAGNPDNWAATAYALCAA